MNLDQVERVIPAAPRPLVAARQPMPRSGPGAAERFAEACATLPGARVLRDVALDEVSLSFGLQTQQIRDGLRARGYRLKLTDWGTQMVLRIPFAGQGVGDDRGQELNDAIVVVLGEMYIADTRIW